MLFLALTKGSNDQNHALSDSHHSIRKFHQQNFLFLLLGRIFPDTPQHYLENTNDGGYTTLSKTKKFHVNYNPIIQLKKINF